MMQSCVQKQSGLDYAFTGNFFFYILQPSHSPMGRMMLLALLIQDLAWIFVTSMWKHKLERSFGNHNISLQSHACLVLCQGQIYCSTQACCTSSQIQFLFFTQLSPLFKSRFCNWLWQPELNYFGFLSYTSRFSLAPNSSVCTQAKRKIMRAA